MLDPETLGKRMREHFATVSDEEFLANLRRYNPDFAQELGLGTVDSPQRPLPRSALESVALRSEYDALPTIEIHPEAAEQAKEPMGGTRRHQGFRVLVESFGRSVLNSAAVLGKLIRFRTP